MNRLDGTVHLYGMVDGMAIRSAELIRAAIDGDEIAFTEIVSRHHRDLQRVAYTICRDAALAEDAVQGAWAIAWRRLHEVRDPDRLQAWLVAVTVNEARRIVRSRRRVVREISVMGIELGETPDERPDPLARGISSADLSRALDALDPADRALIALRYVAELPSDEIGRILGLSPSGARGRLSRLLVRLRAELTDG